MHSGMRPNVATANAGHPELLPADGNRVASEKDFRRAGTAMDCQACPSRCPLSDT
jgi:hypothetical protein